MGAKGPSFHHDHLLGFIFHSRIVALRKDVFLRGCVNSCHIVEFDYLVLGAFLPIFIKLHGLNLSK
jgi:hypothetical protein